MLIMCRVRHLLGLRPAVQDTVGGRIAALPPRPAEGCQRGEELHDPQGCGARRFQQAVCAGYLAGELGADAGCRDARQHPRLEHCSRVNHALRGTEG